MKQFFISCIVVFTCVFNALSQNDTTIVIPDEVEPSMNNIVKPAPAKSSRLRSAYGGNLKPIFQGNGFTPAMKSAIYRAVDLWAEQLFINTEVSIVFQTASLDALASKTTVSYIEKDGKAYPRLLALDKGYYTNSGMTDTVSKIEINENPDFWDYYVNGVTDPTKTCLETAALRAIARVLGFGTFREDGLLMLKNLRKGNRIIEIDAITQQCMRLVGWEAIANDLSINGIDITDNGLGSAYSSYSFTANCPFPVSNQVWKYELINNQGKYVTVQSGNTNTFTINPISNLDTYQKNTKGDITGRIVLTATVNGQTVERIFNLNLESDVSEIKVHPVKLERNSVSGLFELTLAVEYYGGNYLDMVIEQENIMSLNHRIIQEKDYAVAKFINLSHDRYIWFDFTTSNQYGKTTYMYEVEPLNVAMSISPVIHEAAMPHYYNVYDMYGRTIGTFNSETEIYDSALSKGIYIVRETDKNGHSIDSKKIIIK
jgi:hypothetical protein